MRLIDLRVFVQRKSANTNNAYHVSRTYDVRFYIFGFEWRVLEFTVSGYVMDEDNEVNKLNKPKT